MAKIESYQVGISQYDYRGINNHAIPIPTVEGLSGEEIERLALGVLEAMRSAIRTIPTSTTRDMLLADGRLSPDEIGHNLDVFRTSYEGISNPYPVLGKGVLRAFRVEGGGSKHPDRIKTQP